MKEKLLKLINNVADILTKMVIFIIIGSFIYFVFSEYIYPYRAGQYEFFQDYHKNRK
jgi:Sec-independent protein secretion pathway component TatC